jgi:hypothetical protein
MRSHQASTLTPVLHEAPASALTPVFHDAAGMVTVAAIMMWSEGWSGFHRKRPAHGVAVRQRQHLRPGAYTRGCQGE